MRKQPYRHGGPLSPSPVFPLLQPYEPADKRNRSRQNQSSSPLLRLPGELREYIYELALGHLHIHISTRLGRNPLEQRDDIRIFSYRAAPEHCMSDNLYHRTHYTAKLSIQLIYTCRQIYEEAKLLPYSLNVFSFSKEVAFDWFIEAIRPVQRRAIRHMETDWVVGKGTLRDLQGLKQVSIALKQWRDDRPRCGGLAFFNGRQREEMEWIRDLETFWNRAGVQIAYY